MSMFDTRPEKRIANDHATTRPTYIGTDEHGGVHFWSIIDRRVIVVEDGEVDTCDLGDVDRPLQHWDQHTQSERGWADCMITSDDMLAGGL